MPQFSATENDSSFGSSDVITALETDAPAKTRPKFSFGRLAILFMMAATGWSLGFMMAPPQVMLLEPSDDDLVMLNGCVISACSYMASVRAQHKLEGSFWSRVMLVRYKGSNAGHAYCVWQTDGHMFGYDRAGGSFPIPGTAREPKAIAESLAGGLESAVHRTMLVERAEFIEPKNAKLYAY
ncbi:MAG: hypothetical protein QOE70_1707 [Chthoniobacter sp.]|jgi:hypothetical protein|nr:hypothetical protein [Chthoniobacter sp.]